MSIRETARLAELEKTIAKGQKTFVDVGLALAEIRDLRLYKREYGSFAEYCQKKWGWTRQHAYRLIEAAPIGKCHHVVTDEATARVLAGVDPSQRDGLIETVVEAGKPVTAAELKRHLPPPPSFAKATEGRPAQGTGHPPSQITAGQGGQNAQHSTLNVQRSTGNGGNENRTPNIEHPTSNQTNAVRDKIGREIPECCLEVWNRAQEAQDILTAISRIRGVLRKAQDNQDRFYAEINFSGAMSYLDQAYTELKTALPYTVCPSCQGHLAKTCRLCKGRGMISEYRWDTCVPEETKRIVMKTCGNHETHEPHERNNHG